MLMLLLLHAIWALIHSCFYIGVLWGDLNVGTQYRAELDLPIVEVPSKSRGKHANEVEGKYAYLP